MSRIVKKNLAKGLVNTKYFYEEFIKEFGIESNKREKNKVIINYTEFLCINDDFAKLIGEEIIYNKYRLYLGSGLGFLKLCKVERNLSKKKIDFISSNKIKEEILTRGGIPYKEIGGWDEEKQEYKNNGGEKWIVYYTDEYYPIFHWSAYKRKSKINSSKYFLLFFNLKFWKMKPIYSFYKRMYKALKEGEIKVNKLNDI